MKAITGRTDNTPAGQLLYNLNSVEPEVGVNNNVEEMMKRQCNEMRAILLASAAISIAVPLIVSYFNRL